MRHLKRRPLIGVAWLVIGWGLLAGCDSGGSSRCRPACRAGLTCNTSAQTCVPPKLDRYDGEPGGRSVQLSVIDDRAYLAAIAPQTGTLTVGVGVDDPTMYALTVFDRPAGLELAMGAAESTVAVAWLGRDDHYRVAVHQVDDAPDRWRILAPMTTSAHTYQGTQHFDLAVDVSGRIFLAFHDSDTGALESLSGSIGEANWSLDVVDDPNEQGDSPYCKPVQRRREARGLGYYPDVVFQTGTVFIAYQDGDCGDLRLASRVDNQWTFTGLNAGDVEGAAATSAPDGAAGQFPSVGFDSSGGLAIAYQDPSRGRLLIAYDREGTLKTEVVDPGFEVDSYARRRKHLVGGYASLTFDENDVPMVAYIDSTTTQLRVAHRTRRLQLDGTWAQRTVERDVPTGFWASMGFSATLGPVIAVEQLRPRSHGAVRSRLEVIGEEDF